MNPIAADKTIVHEHCNEDYKKILLDMTKMRASSGNSSTIKEPTTKCCSKVGCKVSLNKKIPYLAIETSKDSDLSISNDSRPVKAVSGCCSNESYKSSNKKTPFPTTEMSKDLVLGAFNHDNV